MAAGSVIAALALAIWLYLIAARGGFWLANVRDCVRPDPALVTSPDVVAIVPARNEAAVIAGNIKSLLAQEYPGSFRVILIDDQSRDGTADIAIAAARDAKAEDRLIIVQGQPLPANWAGKVWAMKQGVDHAAALAEQPDYLLFTDADIVYEPEALAHLVARAEANSLVLTSLMVKLHCETLAERALIPAFVFFFQMLYPFAWVSDPKSRMAAAAGGCMLVRHEALRQAGGIETISDALIDDCALGRKLKAVGPIWLGLTERVRSLRAYPEFEDIRRMVARSAYDQLHYSLFALAGTIIGMALVYLVPPFFAFFGSGLSRTFGLAAFALMILAFQPILRFYRLSPLWGFALPAIAAAYMVFTLDSAYQHWRGRGGLWKDRVQANASGTR